ncbi:MAG: anti-anti-sigma factor [Bermanella sp.]|jgi:anti-anti-sigma factor
MSFTKREDSNRKTDCCLLDVSSDMTIYSAVKNLQEINFYYSKYNHFEIDLSAVEEIDSSGIQLLLALNIKSKKDGKNVFLCRMSDSVSEVMNLLNISSHFDWVKSE